MKIRPTFRTFVAAGAIAFALAGAHAWLTGDWKAAPPAHAQPTVLAPWAASFTVTNGAVVVIAPANPTRRSFEICNGAAGSLVYALPANNAAGVAVAPTTTSGIPIASNSCFTPPANLLASGSGAGGGQSWNAIASGANAVVAFVEW